METVLRKLSGVVEAFPHGGILASFTGFGASVLAALKVISVVFGALGAVFGCLAGFYTFLVWHQKWCQMRKKQPGNLGQKFSKWCQKWCPLRNNDTDDKP